MKRWILVALALFLIVPVNSDINFGENAFASIKGFFGFEQKPYIPTGTNQRIAADAGTKIESSQHHKCQPCQLKVTNYMDEIQLNTTEWNCIDKVIRNATVDLGNFTSLLLIATKEAVVDQIKDCYAVKSEGIDWFGWWNPQDWWNSFVQANFWKIFNQTDFWKFVTDNYVYIAIAAVASIVVITCFCKLCCVQCKKKHDEEFLE